MKIEHLKEQRYAIDREIELYEFAEECIKHIFKDNYLEFVLHEFRDTYAHINQGCGLSLSCLLANAEKVQARTHEAQPGEQE